MRFDGSLAKTCDLNRGDRLSHVKNGSSGKYPTWYIRSHMNYVKKHVAVCTFIHGERPKGAHVDHIDTDKSNWTASNLRWLDAKENFAQGGQRYWKAVKAQERDDENRLRELRVGLAKRRSYEGEGNPRFGYRSAEEVQCPQCGKVFYQPKCRKAKYCSRGCYGLNRNHKVVSINPVGKQEVYQITVEDTHTFVLANGLVSSNSQIEMRMAAHESQDAYMCQIFHDGLDIHTMTASKVYRKPPEEVDDKKERYPMKRAGFGVLYKITGAGLLDVFFHEGITTYSESDCDRYIEEWYGVFPGIRKWQEAVRGFAIRNGFVKDMFGRRRWVPEVASALPFVKEAGIRQAINAPIQSGAQGVIKEAMRQLMPRVREWQSMGFTLLPLLQIHDELLFEMDEEIVGMVVPQFSEIMVHAVELSVPVKVDAEVGPNWLDMVGFEKWTEERVS
jgi:hypothetical protein